MSKKTKDLQKELYIKAEECLSDVMTEAFSSLTHTQCLELQMNLIYYISSYLDVRL